jgi:rhodanese-related sulfurtransferase
MPSRLDHTPATPVAAAQVRQWLDEPHEVAFLDVREEGEFGWGHPLLAANLPYSRLEANIGRLVPRTGTRIVLIDGDGALAARAARRLAGLGYTQLYAVDGGIEGWKGAGLALFEGVHVPSKAFAEIVEHTYHTPDISAADLKQLQDRGEDLIVLDSRTEDEFTRFHVPGAISVPGGELVHRFGDVVPSPDTLVVVSCAGRTRGIMGAQTLINAAVPNRVLALAGGTQSWRLAGLDLETGAKPTLAPSDTARTVAVERAAELADRYSVRRINHGQLESWSGDTARTTYLIDVRSPAEYADGHLPGAVSVPGGQLLQTLDLWAAVHGARIVLVDDDGVRATVTAHWLHQLGWDAVVLDRALAGERLVTGSTDTPATELKADGIDAGAALAWLGADGRIISASSSADFRKGHPAGAVWSIRPRLDRLPDAVLSAPRLLVVGSDAAVAALLAHDLSESASGDVRVLTGGDTAWRNAGLAWTACESEPADAERIDFLTWNHDRHQGNPAASCAYLAWEGDLPRQIDADGGAHFRVGMGAFRP